MPNLSALENLLNDDYKWKPLNNGTTVAMVSLNNKSSVFSLRINRYEALMKNIIFTLLILAPLSNALAQVKQETSLNCLESTPNVELMSAHDELSVRKKCHKLLTQYNSEKDVQAKEAFSKIFFDFYDVCAKLKPLDFTVLEEAVRAGNIEELRELLEVGADPNTSNIHGTTVLFDAVKKKRFDIVQLLIDYGADVNKADYFGHTPLYIIARDCSSTYGDIQGATLLLSYGADVKGAIRPGEHIGQYFLFSPLFDAVSGGCLELAKLLFIMGADPEVVESLREERPKRDFKNFVARWKKSHPVA